MKDQRQFKQFILLIGEKYGKEISEAMAHMVWQALKDFPDDVCAKAFNHVIARGRFFQDILPDLLEHLEGKTEDRATEAWLKVDHAVRCIGNYASVRFDDPVIHSTVVSMGGWATLGQCEERDWKWKRLEFEKLYNVQQRKNVHPEHLPGVAEKHNLGRHDDSGRFVEVKRITGQRD